MIDFTKAASHLSSEKNSFDWESWNGGWVGMFMHSVLKKLVNPVPADIPTFVC
jgi:hypothetical protein